MANLTQASRELFARPPDERFESIEELLRHCQSQRQSSSDRWQLPQTFRPSANADRLVLALGDEGAFHLNDWSFTQPCGMAGIAKETINHLSPETASRALQETLPTADKPVQILTMDHSIRSIHGVSYAPRVWRGRPRSKFAASVDSSGRSQIRRRYCLA